jgi:hypothetical protein
VVAHSPLDADAQRADLAGRTVRIDPAAGMTLAPIRDDAERGARVDHRGLERANQGAKEEAPSRQGEDRIRDQLAGPVVGHLPAPLDLDHLDPTLSQLGW